VRALSVATFAEVSMGAALFEDDDRWHALMAVDGRRLSDYPYGCLTEESARRWCYTGIDLLLSIGSVSFPPFQELAWRPVEDINAWIGSFYSKPVWQP
jgi:hypothetical protein